MLRSAIIHGCVAVLAAVSVLSGTTRAQSTTFTDRAAFEASLPAGFYFNNFNGTTPAFTPIAGGVSGSGGTPTAAYTVDAPTTGVAAFPDTGFTALGNWSPSENLVVTMTSGNVVSAGAEIWLSDINGNRLAGNVIVDFSDGSQITVPSATSGSFGFAGVTADAPLSTMTLNAVSGQFLNITNLSVAAVPEPSAIALGLTAAGVLGGTWIRRRRPYSRFHR
jgi:hypothetical protein